MSASPCLCRPSWALHFTLGISKGKTEFIKCTSPESLLLGDKQHAASALAYTSSRRAIKARWRLNYINFITGHPDPEWLTRQGGWSDELQWNYCQSTEKWMKRLTPWSRDLQWEFSNLHVEVASHLFTCYDDCWEHSEPRDDSLKWAYAENTLPSDVVTVKMG